MQRVMLIGCCGAGKSTFARNLAMVTGLKVHHLDQYYWKPNWEETDKEEWGTIVEGIADKSSWIIDGNYGGTMDVRIERADTIIYLDYSTVKCLWRITKRIVKYHGKVRPDMPEGCRERFDIEFYHYVATYNLIRRKRTLQKLRALKDTKRILIFKNDNEVGNFLQSMRQS